MLNKQNKKKYELAITTQSTNATREGAIVKQNNERSIQNKVLQIIGYLLCRIYNGAIRESV